MRVLGFLFLSVLTFTSLNWTSVSWGQAFDVTFGTPSLASGDHTESVSGFFDGDCLEDLAYIRGGEVIIVFAPGLYSVAKQVPTSGSATAIARISTDSGQDDLLVADETGLTVWKVDPTTGLESSSIGPSIWANARAIAVGSLSSDSTYPIYGISADGTQLLSWVMGVASTSPAGNEAFDLVVAQWNSTDILAVSNFMYEQHWVVFSTTAGDGFFSLWTPYRAADLAVVRGSGDDRVAVVGKFIGGEDDYVAIVDSTTSVELRDLGNMDIVGMASGDIDGDETDDLVFSHKSSDRLAIFPSPFHQGSLFEIGPLPASPNLLETHTPAILDADQDDDLDLVQLTHGDSSSEPGLVRVHLQETLPLEEGLGQDFGATNPYQPELKQFTYFEEVVQGTLTGFFCFDFDTTTPPAGTTHVEIGFWKSTLDSGVWGPAVPIGRIYDDVDYTSSQKLAFDELPSSSPSRTVYLWAVRYISGDAATQSYARVYSPIIHSFTPVLVPSQSPSILQLAALNGSFDPTTLAAVQDPVPADKLLYIHFTNQTVTAGGSGNDLPSDTGTGTPVRPLPDPSEFPDPRFGEASGT